jgi:hypothetical protein
MRAPLPLALTLAATLLLAGAAGAAPAKKSAPAAKPASGASAKRASAARTPAPGLPRTLEDVHIDGETPVPQVLFITARDQRRFADFQHHRYLPTSRQLGDRSELPSWIYVNPNPGPPAKESTR